MELRMTLPPSHYYRTPHAMALRRKRSRSPGSPTPFERAPKRFSLGTDVFRAMGGNRQELWLCGTDQAADSSRNDNNAAENSMNDASMNPPEISMEHDADMAIDEESPSKSFVSLDELPLQQPSFASHSTIKQPNSTQSTTSIPRSSSDPFLATSFRQPQFATSADASSPFKPSFLSTPPIFNFIPPTPEVAHDAANLDARGYESPLLVKSLQAETPQFKRRGSAPTMGPRADCEKCRMKVPGHAMHITY
ncbi:hypothetical protein FRC04_001026 [Tulasnella sp. 424]|nr:hypothetical protein FRC04_001026 [Tulasnella sp. 424]KAG8977935.1 hypothetical protein FRC05_000463 [Tulasnella sp. 425]